MKEIKALTGLRFIASFYVFVFHLQRQRVLPELGWFGHSVVAQGALGVNIFFVLSGFVLTYSHLNQPAVAYGQFMRRRLLRIAPVYWTGLAAMLAATLLLHQVPAQLSLLSWLNALFLESWVPLLSMKWYGSGGWSVSTEVFFYALFPWLLAALRGCSQRTTLALLVVTVGAATLPGLYFTTHQWLAYQLVYTFPPARLPEFLAGMLAALLVFQFGWRVPGWAAAAGVAVLIVYLGCLAARAEGWVVHNWLLLPTLALVLAALSRRPAAPGWLGSPLLTYLGRLSYGFYIWQITLGFVLDETGLQAKVPLHSLAASLLLLAAGLLLAVLSYHALERPLHAYLSKKLRAAA